MEEEKQFQINLLRLSGKTNVINLETILDTMSFISNNSIEDALFIEQNYLGNLFENKDFVKLYSINSLTDLISSINSKTK